MYSSYEIQMNLSDAICKQLVNNHIKQMMAL